jgi:hypothetical protein
MTERLLAAIATDDSQGATEQELDAAATALGIELPEDYRAMMRRKNGGECDFGESWIVLQSLEAAIERNATFKEAGLPPRLLTPAQPRVALIWQNLRRRFRTASPQAKVASVVLAFELSIREFGV